MQKSRKHNRAFFPLEKAHQILYHTDIKPTAHGASYKNTDSVEERCVHYNFHLYLYTSGRRDMQLRPLSSPNGIIDALLLLTLQRLSLVDLPYYTYIIRVNYLQILIVSVTYWYIRTHYSGQNRTRKNKCICVVLLHSLRCNLSKLYPSLYVPHQRWGARPFHM